MALWTRKEFATLDQAMDYLNGAMVGSVNLHTNGADVDGKTIIIHDGTADRTTTFTAKGRNWTLEEIYAHINATALLGDVASAVITTPRAGAAPSRSLKIFGDPAHTIRGNGTANAELGFPEGATPADDVVQALIPNSDVEYFRSAGQDPNRRWTVVHYT